MNEVNVLVAVRVQGLPRYRENLSQETRLRVEYVTDVAAARTTLRGGERAFDIFVIDNGISDDVYDVIRDVRTGNPRLLILLVDEDADFSTPGRADDVSNAPFQDNELIRKIRRLSEERRLETIRADAMPPIRNFAKALAKAAKGLGRHQAAVSAIQEMGYDHVAFYSAPPGESVITLTAQSGPREVMAALPQRGEATGLIAWVLQNMQSKIAAPGDAASHFLLEKGRFGAAVAAPVGVTMRFGVIIAFRDQPGAIKQNDVLMLELISAQLASALAKELQG